MLFNGSGLTGLRLLLVLPASVTSCPSTFLLIKLPTEWLKLPPHPLHCLHSLNSKNKDYQIWLIFNRHKWAVWPCGDITLFSVHISASHTSGMSVSLCTTSPCAGICVRLVKISLVVWMDLISPWKSGQDTFGWCGIIWLKRQLRLMFICKTVITY